MKHINSKLDIMSFMVINEYLLILKCHVRSYKIHESFQQKKLVFDAHKQPKHWKRFKSVDLRQSYIITGE